MHVYIYIYIYTHTYIYIYTYIHTNKMNLPDTHPRLCPALLRDGRVVM